MDATVQMRDPETLLEEGVTVVEESVGECLRKAAQEEPGRIALVSVASGEPDRTWSYAELFEDAERGARWLLNRFEPGAHLTVWAQNVPEWVVFQYAAALSGMVLVTANANLRSRELGYILKQSQSQGIAYSDRFRTQEARGVLDELRAELPDLKEEILLEDWLAEIRKPLAAQGIGDLKLPDIDPASATHLQYTSGTTGFPKGVLISHRAMITNATLVHQRGGIRKGSVGLSSLPLFHAAGWGSAALGTLLSRGTLVLNVPFDPTLALDAMQRWRAEQYYGVPAMLQMMRAVPDFRSYDLSSLHLILSGGDMVAPEVYEGIERDFDATLTTVYGQTELSPVAAQTAPSDSEADRFGAAGRPLRGTELTIRSETNGEEVGIGQTGEICVRGYQVMLGYHQMSEETAEAIDAQGWLHTGDLGVLDERGVLRVVGRLKDMIIRGGENIYPLEIETLLESHPAIASAKVFGIPSVRWGQTVAAAVIFEPGKTAQAEELHDLVREGLAPHKTPKSWFVVDSFPTNAMARVQKFLLVEMASREELPVLE